MAAGLPVVVSDWDGYRYTVTDGLDGFLIPTLIPTVVKQGDELVLLHDHGLLTYQDYAGSVAQHIAVDTDAAAAAIFRLVSDPMLRQRMGESGRKTVSQRFDWSVVASLHHDLYSELAERRRIGHGGSGLPVQHPLRANPFCDFSTFASSSLGPDTGLCLSLPLSEVQQRLNSLINLDRFYEELHANPTDLERLILQIDSNQPLTFKYLLLAWPDDNHDLVKLSITWLAKLGCVKWL